MDAAPWSRDRSKRKRIVIGIDGKDDLTRYYWFDVPWRTDAEQHQFLTWAIGPDWLEMWFPDCPARIRRRTGMPVGDTSPLQPSLFAMWEVWEAMARPYAMEVKLLGSSGGEAHGTALTGQNPRGGGQA